MSEALDDLRHYLRALETGDPDRQLSNPNDDVKIVSAAIAEIERLTAEKSEVIQAFAEAVRENVGLTEKNERLTAEVTELKRLIGEAAEWLEVGEGVSLGYYFPSGSADGEKINAIAQAAASSKQNPQEEA